MVTHKSSFYEIRLEGHLAAHWSDWFDGLAIHNDPDGETTLSGELADQAALIGLLARIQALNMTLLSVCRKSPDHPDQKDLVDS